MLTQLYKKLYSITSVPPLKDNEIIIRNLTHRLLNEINIGEIPHNYNPHKDVIRQCCLNHIRLLNNNILMSSNSDDYSYEKYNLTCVVKNAVTACNVLLCKTETEVRCNFCPDIYISLPLKPALSFIVNIIRFIYQNYKPASITFKVKTSKKSTLLLAECVNNKPVCSNFSSDFLHLSEKTAELMNGAFVFSESISGFICGLSIISGKDDSCQIQYTPDYVELLIDKMSELHIGLSCLETDHKFL